MNRCELCGTDKKVTIAFYSKIKQTKDGIAIPPMGINACPKCVEMVNLLASSKNEKLIVTELKKLSKRIVKMRAFK